MWSGSLTLGSGTSGMGWMLRGIHEREGRWDEVDPDTEVAGIGEGIGLSEDQSYELFGHLVDAGFVDPGRA